MSEGKKALLLILAFFIIVGGIYTYLMNQQNQRIQTLQHEIQAEQQFSFNLDQKIANRKKLPSPSVINDLLIKVPAYLDWPFLLTQVEHKAVESHLRIQKIEHVEEQTDSIVQESSEDGALKTFTFSIELQGEYTSIRRFIRFIESHKRWIDIKQMKITSEASPESQQQHARFLLTIYHVPFMESYSPGPHSVDEYPVNKDRSLF